MSDVAAASSDGFLDLGKLYPPLAKYCPLTYAPPGRGLHDNVPQCYFLLLDCEEAFYGGAVGGGKSAALLMAALQYVDVPSYRAVIIRRTFAQLDKGDSLLKLSKEWLTPTDAQFVGSPTPTWTFPSGATLEFGHMASADAMFNYQGARYAYVGFDELTQFDETTYMYVAFARGALRADVMEAGVPRRVRSTGNPGGIGQMWVKERFIDPLTRQSHVEFVPAKLADNPGLPTEDYERGLMHLPEEMRRQLMDGDWDVFEGAAYPEFNEALHGVAPLPLETITHWERHESMDHGVEHDTAWLLYLTDYDHNIVVADEYVSPGLVSQHAKVVKERRTSWWERREDEGDGWPGTRVRHVCYGDPSIAARNGGETQMGDPLSVLSLYREHDITIRPGNNRRPAGYSRIRDLLQPVPGRLFPAWHPRYGQDGAPRLFIVKDRCPELWKNMKAALIASGEHDADRGIAVDKDWEGKYGHAHASLRYGLLSPDRRVPKEPETLPEDPRAAAIVVRQRRRAEDWKRKQRGGVGAAGAIDW